MMNRNIFVSWGWLSLCTATVLLAQKNAAHKGDFDLSRYRNNNRLIFVFAPSNMDARYVEQARQFEGKQESINERDLTRFDVLESGDSKIGDAALVASDAQSLRKQFHIRNGAFRVLLVGKDGHTAYSSGKPATAKSLFDLIDSMPMRQQEIKNR